MKLDTERRPSARRGCHGKASDPQAGCGSPVNEQDRGRHLARRGPRLGEEVDAVVRDGAFLGCDAHVVCAGVCLFVLANGGEREAACSGIGPLACRAAGLMETEPEGKGPNPNPGARPADGTALGGGLHARSACEEGGRRQRRRSERQYHNAIRWNTSLRYFL